MSVADKVLWAASLCFIVAGSAMLVVLFCERTWVRLQRQTSAVKTGARRRRAVK